jgi:hypothetical protein
MVLLMELVMMDEVELDPLQLLLVYVVPHYYNNEDVISLNGRMEAYDLEGKGVDD